jgi:hypothetical protein
MALSKVRKVDDTTGPELEATFTADRSVYVARLPETYWRCCTSRTGSSSAEAPRSTSQGTSRRRAVNLVGGGFHVDRGVPSTERSGRRTVV